MTRAELYRWLIQKHGCKQAPLKESTTGRSIKIVNEALGRYAFLDLPFDDTDVKPFQCFHICNQLGVPIPEECDCNDKLEVKKVHVR